MHKICTATQQASPPAHHYRERKSRRTALQKARYTQAQHRYNGVRPRAAPSVRYARQLLYIIQYI